MGDAEMETKDELAVQIYQQNYCKLCDPRKHSIDTIYDRYNEENPSLLKIIGKTIEKTLLGLLT
jgi:RNA processing factor Prp31